MSSVKFPAALQWALFSNANRRSAALFCATAHVCAHLFCCFSQPNVCAQASGSADVRAAASVVLRRYDIHDVAYHSACSNPAHSTCFHLPIWCALRTLRFPAHLHSKAHLLRCICARGTSSSSLLPGPHTAAALVSALKRSVGHRHQHAPFPPAASHWQLRVSRAPLQ